MLHGFVLGCLRWNWSDPVWIETLMPYRMVWPEAPGVTGPTTLHLLCAPSRTSLVCRNPLGFGTPQDSPQTVAWRTSSDVVRQSWSTAESPCSQPWATLLQRHFDSKMFLHLCACSTIFTKEVGEQLQFSCIFVSLTWCPSHLETAPSC